MRRHEVNRASTSARGYAFGACYMHRSSPLLMVRRNTGVALSQRPTPRP
jgi:hypothetical protein